MAPLASSCTVRSVGTVQQRFVPLPMASMKRPARQLSRCAYVGQAPAGVAQEQPANLLDAAMNAVLAFFDDKSQPAASEELQLPPELKAYLEEMEAHGSGSHGGWVHSHIAERLASTGDDQHE